MCISGYSPTQKGYKCYHSPTQKVLVSKNATFIENQSFFKVSTFGPQGENVSIDHGLPILEESQPYQLQSSLDPNSSNSPIYSNPQLADSGDWEPLSDSPILVQLRISHVQFKDSPYVYKRKGQPNPGAM